MDLHAVEAYYRAHRPTLQNAGREYAVLVPLVEKSDGLYLLYEVRAASLRHHSREVCFPGGQMEQGEDAVACALREAQEELGIEAQDVRIFGEADFLYLRSESLMRPVVAQLDKKSLPRLHLNDDEVSNVFLVSVQWLQEHPPKVYRYPLLPDVPADFPYETVQTPADYKWAAGSIEVPVYEGLPHPLWGLTARITMHLIAALRDVLPVGDREQSE